MPMIRCDANEHYYDNSKHSSCPFCGNARGNDDKTSFIQPQREDSDKTKLVGNTAEIKTVHKHDLNKKSSNEDADIQSKKGETMKDKSEHTIAPWQRAKINEASTNDKYSEKQSAKSKFSNAPIVGWLVIIEGNNQGQDYRIIPGINTIGRDDENVIVINTDDKEISRDKHCVIEYEVKNKKFYLERGTTTTYLNDNRVGGDGTELNSGDIIEIGATKLKFIPFCSADFCWNM